MTTTMTTTTLTPAQASRDARAVLGAAGMALFRRVTSRPGAPGTRLAGMVRTDVQPVRWVSRDQLADMIEIVQDLPGYVADASTGNMISFYRNVA